MQHYAGFGTAIGWTELCKRYPLAKEIESDLADAEISFQEMETFALTNYVPDEYLPIFEKFEEFFARFAEENAPLTLAWCGAGSDIEDMDGDFLMVYGVYAKVPAAVALGDALQDISWVSFG